MTFWGPKPLEGGPLKAEPKFSSVACWAYGFEPQSPTDYEFPRSLEDQWERPGP